MSEDQGNKRLSALRTEVDRLLAGKTFAKSVSQARLLNYLASCTERGETPKELAIAIDVFGRDESFDPAANALVRVNVHKLRKLLDKIYAAEEAPAAGRLDIPKGGYEIILSPPQKPTNGERLAQQGKDRRLLWAACAALVVSLGVHVIGLFDRSGDKAPANPLWAGFTASQDRTILAVGDMYVYSERKTGDDGGARFIRDTRVNSDADFQDKIIRSEADRARFKATEIRYVPQSTAETAPLIVSALEAAGGGVEIRTRSQLTPADLRDHNFVYLGPLKSMGFLRGVLNASAFECDADCVTLINRETRESFATRGSPEQDHVDYGYIAQFIRPNSGAVLVLAGFSDAGLRQAVVSVTGEGVDPVLTSALQEAGLSIDGSFEALYQVNGHDYNAINAELAYVGVVNSDAAWRFSLSKEIGSKDLE